MEEIVHEFLLESHENLDQLDRDLVALEAEPSSRELLSSIFRVIHTIKGTTGFLAFDRLEALTHVGESLLARLRDGAQPMTPATADALLAMIDAVRSILASIEATGAEGNLDVGPIIARVTATMAGSPRVTAQPDQEPDRPTPEAFPAGQPQAPGRPLSDTSVRVDVRLLDALMRIVGELVLTRNQLLQGLDDGGDPALARTVQRLNLLTGELQDNVMKTRMQPIENVFSKLPRQVRDLSATLGKQIRVMIEGGDTELDRTLLEAVRDPLTHLVRNAVDHGVERPEVRRANGKSPEGTLRLRAHHTGGNVVVEVADDGAGMNPEVIGRVAVQRGVVSADELALMRPLDVLRLVFAPAFSTAPEVTTVSGRGVGMDVVKTNIERIGGTVDVESTVSMGTTWRLTIPLTLAIIRALLVDCGSSRYAIPQSAVRELLFVNEDIGQRIEYIDNAPVYRLRGSLLPLIPMTALLDCRPVSGSTAYVAVVQAHSRRYGLLVDRVLNTEEIVVKPLSARFNEVGIYAGATILGDGKIALILDVQALARRSGLALSNGDVDPVTTGQGVDDLTPRAAGRLLLTGVGERYVAIPLSTVARLENFTVDQVERVGHREVVQYGGTIMPIVRLTDLLGAESGAEPGQLLVVIHTENGRSAGLAVDQILDIVPEAAVVGGSLDVSGLAGSTLVNDRVTELLDVRSALLAADPMFFADQPLRDAASAGA